MRFPFALTAKIAAYIIGKKLQGEEKFATVLQLEPLHTCNLTCTGCGRIREYSTSLKNVMLLADCLAATEWAVHLAESLQVPAIVLSDQYFGQARAVVDIPTFQEQVFERLKAKNGEPYKRYALTTSGISPMAIPGTAGLAYTADGLEHNERGIPSSQASDHLAQMDKRARKLAQLDPGDHWASVEGEGEIAVLTFGSCTGPVREAFARARADGVAARLVSLRLLSPAQPERLKRALAGVKRVLVVEQNHSGQFLRYLRGEYDLPGEVTSLRRPGPLPFRPDEIHRRLVEWGVSETPDVRYPS
ncbi:MAG: transketolase C-terminal domain-containing protein, partial [candidate division NC10 bacterium]